MLLTDFDKNSSKVKSLFSKSNSTEQNQSINGVNFVNTKKDSSLCIDSYSLTMQSCSARNDFLYKANEIAKLENKLLLNSENKITQKIEKMFISSSKKISNDEEKLKELKNFFPFVHDDHLKEALKFTSKDLEKSKDLIFSEIHKENNKENKINKEKSLSELTERIQKNKEKISQVIKKSLVLKNNKINEKTNSMQQEENIDSSKSCQEDNKNNISFEDYDFCNTNSNNNANVDIDNENSDIEINAYSNMHIDNDNKNFIYKEEKINNFDKQPTSLADKLREKLKKRQDIKKIVDSTSSHCKFTEKTFSSRDSLTIFNQNKDQKIAKKLYDHKGEKFYSMLKDIATRLNNTKKAFEKHPLYNKILEKEIDNKLDEIVKSKI